MKSASFLKTMCLVFVSAISLAAGCGSDDNLPDAEKQALDAAAVEAADADSESAP